MKDTTDYTALDTAIEKAIRDAGCAQFDHIISDQQVRKAAALYNFNSRFSFALNVEARLRVMKRAGRVMYFRKSESPTNSAGWFIGGHAVGHPHAAAMAQYAADAACSKEPWKQWEGLLPGRKPLWLRLNKHPQWEPKAQYRRSPK